jgi:hypothetical protein
MNYIKLIANYLLQLTDKIHDDSEQLFNIFKLKRFQILQIFYVAFRGAMHMYTGKLKNNDYIVYFILKRTFSR